MNRNITAGLAALAALGIATGSVWLAGDQGETEIVLTGPFGGPGADSHIGRDVDIRVVEFLENNESFRREVTEERGWQPVCAANTFGFVPGKSNAGVSGDTAYAWVHCRWLPSGDSPNASALRETDALSALIAPVVVHFDANASYKMAADGEAHEASVKEIFPKKLWSIALNGTPAEDSMISALNVRIAERFNVTPRPEPTS